MADFDWSWPPSATGLSGGTLAPLSFIEEAANIVLIGPNGIGKNNVGEKPPASGHPARSHGSLHARLRHAA